VTATISEIELTELIDLDSDVECGWEGCGNEATWICHPKCNAEDGIHCNVHKKEWMNRAASYPFVRCNHCGEVSLHWENLFTWRPL
jgi:hypothetical protein